jgi:ATP-dependent RNA helicase HrpB
MTVLPQLPILDLLPQLAEALSLGTRAVLEAPPGAGKSTVVPLALLDAPWRGGRRILMLEPRRIAARAVAERMATTLGERSGERVGFRTRLESRAGPLTRVEVVTEGILTRMLQRDPALEGVACVVFDEFHERSMQADLGLALALECQRHLRPDLRLLVMSATLDGEALTRLMGDARLLRSTGRMFEVGIVHAAAPVGTPATAVPSRGAELAAWVASRIASALEAHDGDVLAFLPGAAEIRRVIGTLGERLPTDRYALLPLYGDLPSRDQDAVLRPDARGRRKIIVATNIAETSLTIDGVRIVVDSGLERRNRFDPATGMSRLETVRISRASADQRRGRAGRTAPGVCYRLWSESAHAALLPQTPPEILEADLAPLALELACWGTDDVSALAWLDPPPAAALSQARALLARLEALDETGRITPLGRRMAALGMHPRLAHLVLRSAGLGLEWLGCTIAALLSERDPLRSRSGPSDPDLRSRIDALRGGPLPHGHSAERAELARIERVAKQVERQLAQLRPVADRDGSAIDEPDAVGLLLAFAYPDRIGRSRGEGVGRYVLAGGRGAVLPGPSALARSEYIVVAAIDAGHREARVQLAAPLDPMLLEQHFGALVVETTCVEWDPRSESVAARRLRRLGDLVIDEAPLRGIVHGAVAAMIDGIRTLGLGCLPWTKELEQWRARVAFARANDVQGADAWPDLSDAALLRTLDAWLGPWLEGVTRREHLARLDLRGALLAMLDWNAQRRLDAFAPTHLQVPSGSRIAIDYSNGVPTLAVRLQEVFGLADSPRVGDGRVPVTMELLSPARRPVQVTRDLESFWSRGYHEVRKELKGRYPKHYWPDDPREAIPTRRVRPPA